MAGRIDGGFRVKRTVSGSHFIDLVEMLFNWRLVTSPAWQGDMPHTYDRGWCYIAASKGESFRDALLAAWLWDGHEDTEPPGYGKALQPHRVDWFPWV